MNENIKIVNIPAGTSIVTGTKFLGIQPDGKTRIFEASLLRGNRVGSYKTTDGVPTPPLLNQYLDLVGTGVGSSPSGTYTNLLTTGGAPIVVPTPASGHAIISAQAYWNGTVWILQYQDVVLIDTSNFALKTDVPTVTVVNSKNLYDKSVSSDGVLLGVDGTLQSGNPTYTTSDKIPVTPGLQYYGAGGGNAMRRTGFFNASNILVGSVIDANTNLVTAPAGATYIRFSFLVASKNVFQFEQGNAATSYVPFSQGVQKINGITITNSDKTIYTTAEVDAKIATVNAAIPAVVSTNVPGSKNLFNKATVLVGQVLNQGLGTVSASASYDTSDYIPIDSYATGKILSGKNLTTGDGFRRAAFYTAANEASYLSSGTDAMSFAIAKSAGANYIRVSIPVAALAAFQLEANDTSTAYVDWATPVKTLVSVAGAVLPSSGGGTTPAVYDANVAFPKVINALVGQELNIYYDAWNVFPEYGGGTPSTFMFDFTCTKGVTTNRSFQYTPLVGDLGTDYALTIQIIDSYGTTLQSITSTIHVVQRVLPGSVLNFLNVADSTWHNGGTDGVGAVAINTLGEILTAIGGNVPVFFGQQQPAPYHNEARSGRAWSSFANGALVYKLNLSGLPTGIDFTNLRSATYFYTTSGNYIRLVERWVRNGDGTGYAIGYSDGGSFSPPVSFPATMTKGNTSVESTTFPSTITVTSVEVINNFSIFKDAAGTGVLNFNYYVETVLGKAAGTKIHVAHFDLGINDTSSPTAVIADIITAANALITALKAHNPTIKIIISYPKSRSSDYYVSTRKRIRYTMQALRKALLTAFDNNAVANVYIAHSGINMDRFYGYPLVTNAYSGIRLNDATLQYKATINDVHPSDFGNKQIADGVIGTLVYALNL